jgi:hypothetical protein
MTAVRGASALSGVLAVSIALLSAACERNPHEPLEPLTPPPPGWAVLGLQGRTITELSLHENVLYAGTDRGLFRRNLSGTDSTWQIIGFSDRAIHTLLPLSGDVLLASVSALGEGNDTISIFRTTNRGRNWSPYQNGFGGGTHVREALSLARSLDGALLAGGRAFVVVRSTDGGRSWRKLTPGPWDGSAQVHFVQQDPRRPNTIWAGGQTGRFTPFLLKSDDGGVNWREYHLSLGGDNAHNNMVFDPSNTGVMYSGMEERVMKTVDGGESWQTTLTSDANMYGLAISTKYPGRIYAAGASASVGRELLVYVSSDGGISWVVQSAGEVFSLTDGNRRGVFSLLLAEQGNAEVVYLGTSDGVYRYVPET